MNRALSSLTFITLLLITWPAWVNAQEIRIDNDDLGGVVTSSNGPEAGVWVIAETTDLPTKFVKIVVTDDQGRYLIPDLPSASYRVWVRGYGLVDSPQVRTEPGKILNLKAVLAPSAAAAAEYYPPLYWLAMLAVPEESEFPGTGPDGNGVSENFKHRGQWLREVKSDGCNMCHQLGNKATREIPEGLGDFDSSVDAWGRRIESGQAMMYMVRNINRMGRARSLELFADWTDRIAAGELPAAKPTRPQGLERNVVVTQWDWSDPKYYLHDQIATDKRNPTVNANGPIYGSPEDSTDFVPILDPVNHRATEVKVPVRDPETPSSKSFGMAPSPYWGEERIWDSQASVHNPMLDEKGQVWFTSRIRPRTTQPFCQEGSDHPSAKLFPIKSSGRQLSMYDPETKEFTLVDTCFSTHHLQFAEDANNTLWLSGGVAGSDVVGWLNKKMFEETGDEQKSQGWTALILDTNGNGKRDDYVEPDQSIDPAKDKRIRATYYGIAVSPVDGSVWGSVMGFPGSVVRLTPGDNPPATSLAEIFEPPWDHPDAPVHGYSPHGIDVDRSGVVWVPLASGHLGSFDRRKCQGPLNGPKATGQHCQEGWTLYPFPGPQLKDVTDSGSAESAYYTWVDQFDTFGLGKDV
ncbi:MAG: carboxypeptidase-like regulatory domain-containing protein, partial [Acidobacteriota bacterium]